VKPKVQLEETRFKLRHDSKSFEAFYPWPDEVSALTGRVRSVLAVTAVSTRSTGCGPPMDRTWWSGWPESERVSDLIGRDWEINRTHLQCVRSSSREVLRWPDASGHHRSDSTVRPVKVQYGSCTTGCVQSCMIGLASVSGHSAPLVLNSTVAIDRTRPVTSTGASGQYVKCWVGT
jgi:hypothetical protein